MPTDAVPHSESAQPPYCPTLQQLSPQAARLCLNVRRFSTERLHLQKNVHLLLALSGGADSTALAVILHILAPGLGLTLRAMTLNHGLRPEATQEQEYVLALCRNLNIPCSCHTADVAELAQREGMGLEEAGRSLRYALLEEERKAHNAAYIVLGHHAEDLSEDVLLRLIRGTGWPGLGGMQARDEKRHLLRPLLAVRPQQLKALLTECNITWCTDASNADRSFRRNRLRLDVLPQLRAENPSLERSVQNLWQLARLDESYWETLLNTALSNYPWQITDGGLLLPAELLETLHPAARLRLYIRALRMLESISAKQTANQGQARATTLLALEQALQQRRGNTRFLLPGGTEVRLKRGAILFCRCPA